MKLDGSSGTVELRRLVQLHDEDHMLVQLGADLSLDKHILHDVLAEQFWSLPGNALVREIQDTHGVSERRGCGALGIGRLSLHYRLTNPN